VHYFVKEYGTQLLPSGVDFTNLFRQAKSCRRTAFGEKIAINFTNKVEG
jgi:hypothetical protein